jgi:hypothetical protein
MNTTSEWVHQIQVDNELLVAENQKLREALTGIADLPEPLGGIATHAGAQCEYVKAIASDALQALERTTT